LQLRFDVASSASAICVIADCSRTPQAVGLRLGAPLVSHPRLILKPALGTHARRSPVEYSENEFRLVTDATVRLVEDDGEGRFVSTLRFEQLDRATRSSIVRFALDQERQDAGRRRIQGA
jgi:hypothetical protein